MNVDVNKQLRDYLTYTIFCTDLINFFIQKNLRSVERIVNYRIIVFIIQKEYETMTLP